MSNFEEDVEKEVSFEKILQRRLMKYRRLFPSQPIYYRGFEAINTKTLERGVVDSITLGDVEVAFPTGKRRVQSSFLMPAEVYDSLNETITLVSIHYKASPKFAVLKSAGTFLLPCSYFIDNWKHVLHVVDRERLKGKDYERYPFQFKKFLTRISWNDLKKEEIDNLTDEELEELRQSDDYTLDNVLERIKDVYKISPCDECTVPKTCDCRLRIVKEIKGDSAASYKTAQKTFREHGELMSFLLTGVFRGNSRVRWVDYDVWLQQEMDKTFDAEPVKKLLKAIHDYEEWSGVTAGEDVMTTIDGAIKSLGFKTIDELE